MPWGRAVSALAVIALVGWTGAGASGSDAPTATNPTKPVSLSLEGEFTQGGYLRGQLPGQKGWTITLDGEPLALSDDGRFFAAFDRDAEGQATLSVSSASGEGFTRSIKVRPRQWQISRVNVPKRPGGSSEAWWKKRKPEWEAIVAARAIETDASGWRQDFVWPVKGRISGLFGRQRIYQGEPGSYHSGIDIAPGNGVPYVAPADGVVVLARTGFSLEGGLIIIDHGGGLNSAFLHSSKILV
ncbi:MAG: M23 family metallopeptidase, partial [Erythrobacter sp.]|nr:M23 family metallopeptidase [Erythrobacter sp.]